MVAVKVSCRFGKLIIEETSSMLVPKLLSGTEIKTHLKKLSGWRHEGKFITRTFEFDHFMDAIAFVNEVAEAAEREEHHPDINIRYTTVKLSIQTHSEGGVTEWDIGLAKAIDVLEKAARESAP